MLTFVIDDKTVVLAFVTDKTVVLTFVTDKTKELTLVTTKQKNLHLSPGTSDAHFSRSPVIDRLKSTKTDCSNPHQDFGLIEVQIWWSRIP